MPVVIPDEVLRAANLTEREALVEIACRLYDAGRIGKGLAARMAGMDRAAFEDELIRRDLPLIRYTEEMLEQDIRTLEKLSNETESARADRGQ